MEMWLWTSTGNDWWIPGRTLLARGRAAHMSSLRCPCFTLHILTKHIFVVPIFAERYIYAEGERDNVAGANITFSAASPLQRLLCDRAKVILRKRVCLHTRGRKSISTISVLTMDRLFSERACYFWDSGGGANYYSVWRPGCLLRGVGVADKIKYQRTCNILLFCFSSGNWERWGRIVVIKTDLWYDVRTHWLLLRHMNIMLTFNSSNTRHYGTCQQFINNK